MNSTVYKTAASTLLLGVFLTACGGSSESPGPTLSSATVNVASATDVALNGAYTTTAIQLSPVSKINPVGGDPELCSFRFSGLQQTGGTRAMDGDIRYIPGGNGARVIFVSIAGVEFSSRDPANAAVDRPNNKFDFAGKVLTASTGGTATISLTGSVPMRTDRPEGC